ncbi:hypothetical protein AAHE18_20G093200 [Arachis hypogaea]
MVKLGILSSLTGLFLPPTNLAGFPTTVVLGGTSLITTEPAPILAHSPTLMFPKIQVPAPIKTPSPIFGCLSPEALPVSPKVTLCKIDTLLPVTAVSPTTNPVA